VLTVAQCVVKPKEGWFDMAKVKKMAFGGLSKLNQMRSPAANAARTNAVNTARQQQMAEGREQTARQQQMNDAANFRKMGPVSPRVRPGAGLMGLGSAMSGPKTGLGTAMGMNKMAGAGVALGKKLGMKSGGSVGSASKRADGIATKGKTKGKMV